MTEPAPEIITRAQVDELGKVRALRPIENDFKSMPGYYQRPKAGGGYDWGVNFTPNDGHGKLTREASAIGEAMKPFQRADTERHLNNQKTPWMPRWRPRGKTVSRVGPDGVMWKLVDGRWVEA